MISLTYLRRRFWIRHLKELKSYLPMYKLVYIIENLYITTNKGTPFACIDIDILESKNKDWLLLVIERLERLEEMERIDDYGEVISILRAEYRKSLIKNILE